LGSADTISCTNTILNTIVANSLREFADKLENSVDFKKDLNKLLVETLKKHKRVIFNGNGYDASWVEEAERRGLALVNAHVIVANFEEGGDTTQHHHDSLMERFNVMAEHYGYIQTILLHGWLVVRAVFMR
jgi:glutamine synthetase type III